MHGIQLWHELGDFLPRFLALGAAPSSFYFSCRFDEAIAAEAVLDQHLPELARQGHRLLMGNIGLENFSSDENERFNKGLPAATLDRGIALLRRLESDFPGTFLFSALGGFGFIMYSPWTRLEDLETNLEAFRRNKLPMEGLHFSSAVQLLPGRAITLLAERDGLTVERFTDRRFDSGCMTEWNDYEIPWRFEHPEVQAVFSVARRIFQEAPKSEDPLDLEVQAWVEAVGGTRDDADRLFEALLVSIRAEPDADPRRLMQLAREHLPAPGRPSPTDGSERAEPEGAPRPPPQWLWLAAALEENARSPESERELAPLRVERCEVAGADPAWSVRLHLRDGEEGALTIEVRRRQEGEKAFLERGRWAVSYRDEQGIALPLITRACKRVLETTGRALASLRGDA